MIPQKRNSLTVQTSPLHDNKESPRTERSPFKVPLYYEPFARSFIQKHEQGLFLGRTPQKSDTNRRQYSQICRIAKNEYLKGPERLEPSPLAIDRTKRAASAFFSLSFQLLDKTNKQFPLAGRNKCIGMVAVPSSKLVIIAISQDKNPELDVPLRKEMINFLKQLNSESDHWKFELACIPTQAQYLMPRTISMRTPSAASEESVKPHTRCVEVAIMASLCKAGRTKKFTSQDTGIIAFGGTLWASIDSAKAMPHFESKEIKRNKKYASQAPLEVNITPSLKAYADVWDPCPEHCAVYKYEMLAIGGAGGFSSSFFEPRAEAKLEPYHNHIKQLIALGLVNVAMFGTGIYFGTRNQNVLENKNTLSMLLAGMISSVTFMGSLHFLFSTNKATAKNQKSITYSNEIQSDIAEIEFRDKRSNSCSF